MKNKILLIYFLGFIGLSANVSAQSLLDTLEEKYPDSIEYESSTFKASRISIGHSVETRKKGILEIQTMSRFWNIPNFDPAKRSQSLIVDKMSTRIGLEYGISDRLTFSVGATTLDGIFDSFFKYKLLRQTKNSNKSPFSISLFLNASLRTHSASPGDVHLSSSFGDKLAFTNQVLIARKISHQFSLQVSPTFIHRVSNRFDANPQNHFAMGLGGRYKVGEHISIVSEYYYQANPLKSKKTYDAISLGVNWELSDVMLQFQLTNIRGATEDAFITQTPNNFNFNDGNFVFGFTGIFILHTRNALKKLK